MPRRYSHYKTSIGNLTIAETDGKITQVGFGKTIVAGAIQEETTLIRKTIEQIQEYLLGERTGFDLPVQLLGTEFQLRVWDELSKIPYGETRSYKDIAQMAGSSKAYRAVGNANNKNPVAIIIP